MINKSEQNYRLWQEYKPTARGVDEHFENLGLSIDMLRGKKILDIGAGLNKLANELEKEKLDIVSLDPFYMLSIEEREKLYEDGYEDGSEKLKELLYKLGSKDKSSHLVAGRSEALPFADDSFDLIISHYGSPFYAEDSDGVEQFFSELNRVLVSGGEARIYPKWIRGINQNKASALNKALKKALDDLEKKGFHIETNNRAWILKKEQKTI